MIKVDFCGYNLTELDGFTIRRTGGSGDFLFLLLKTPFYIYSVETITTRPMACILFPPNEPHHYKAVQTFTNSFIHFTPDYDFLSMYKIPTATVIYPKRPDVINQILKHIVIESVDKSLHYEQKIDCLTNELFIEISRDINNIEHNKHDMSLYSQFQKIRLSLINHCESDWTTESICKLAHMEKSQFYSYYASFFNTTPKADIISARIEKAKNLLTNQELKVNQVAEICGFKNASHFTRCFKKYVNCTPNEFSSFTLR
ncbi:MAG: helix-turn-helix transcriptional regulator [Defluviitaleaceae bacterium]|nr:helix-turn-helix transcriptional regulator [Defluviitaleaceae bacterium]